MARGQAGQEDDVAGSATEANRQVAKTRGSIAHALRALSQRNYRLFFFGQLVSLIGTWMQQIAQQWLVYRLTGSAAWLGTVAFCGQVPAFALAPIGGLAADRLDRRWLLVGTQTISAVLACVLGLLTLMGTVTVGHILWMAALLGIVNAFDVPARQAFVVDMVGRDLLLNAIALNSSIFNAARILGPAVAGLLVAAVGEGWCFELNGLSFVAVIVGLMLMDVATGVADCPQGSAYSQTVEGFRYVWTHARVRALLVQLGLIGFFAMPYTLLMPIFADRILHRGSGGLGLLMGANGAGALMATVILAMRDGATGLSGWVALSTAGSGIGLVLFAYSHSFPLSMLLMVVCGFCLILTMAASNTLLQMVTPDKLRGRVMSVYTMTFFGTAPLGSLLAGHVAQRMGAPVVVAVGGAMVILTAAAFAAQLPDVCDSAAGVPP